MADDLDDDWWQTDDKNKSSNKRGRSASEESEPEETNQLTTKASDASETTKKKKRRKKKKSEDVKKQDALVPLHPHQLAEDIKSHFAGKLTAVENDDLNLSSLRYLVCNETNHSPSAYLKMAVPKWKGFVKRMKDTPGSPLMLVVTSSGLRAAQLIREISEFKGTCKTAKLFAKHLKISEQKVFLSKNVIGLGVGTPARIDALLDDECVKVAQLRFVVLDYTWRDVKQRRFMDIPEVKKDFMTLAQKHLLKLSSQVEFGLM